MSKTKSIAEIMIEDVFDLRKDENIIITVDRGSERAVMSEMLDVAHRRRANRIHD